MLTDRLARGLSSRQHRLDPADKPIADEVERSPSIHSGLLAAVTIGFVLLGGGSLELGEVEARLGLAAGEPLGPFGQVFGGYDPSLAPGRVAISRLWVLLEGGASSLAAIRWPSAIAAAGIGLLLARRVSAVLGARAGLLAGLAIMATLGFIDRSASLIGDPVMGLAVLATIDRALSRETDWIAGLLGSIALIMGGWPALAAILLPLIAIGRPGSSLSYKILLPPLATFAAWSIWACATTDAEVWAATLTLPISSGATWTAGLWALVAGLPWTPVAAVAAWPSVRSSLGAPSRRPVMEWLKVAAVGMLAATIIPGMGPAGGFLVLGGLAVAAAIVLDQAWSGKLPLGPKITGLGISTTIGIMVGAVAIWAGAYLAMAQPYYRGIGIVCIGLGLTSCLSAVDSIWVGYSRGVVRTLLIVALIAKTLHYGYHMPESNYRFGKGPWGRAVGQHVPPKSPIYVFVSISPALAFATEHSVYQLRAEEFLKVQPGEGAKFVLLTDSEFAHWPTDAPPIQKVRAFEDEFGGTRVLARTAGRLVPRDDD